ncbi:MAG: hypothetical protein M5T61_13590 [Acidimicrobiia bacterium]|nr:hypothetical protein [Acidimicrobiia bacterium]
MLPSELEKLARTHAFPAVTLLLPTQRERPGNAEDRLRLRHLVDRATEELLRGFDRREVAPLVERLNTAAAEVDFSHPGSGLAILATTDESHVFAVPFALPERVVVNERFAVRDLLVGVHRMPRYRVLVLSAKKSRLLEGSGTDLAESRSGAFPVEVEPPREEDTPHKDLPIHESQREEGYRFVFRAVDRALDEIDAASPLPVVLVGVERDLSFFREVTRHGRSIVGQVAGNHVADSPAELGRLVAPAIEAHTAAEASAAVAELREAVGTGRASSGINDVFALAHEGRGRRLVVEEDYRYPAHISGDGRSP